MLTPKTVVAITKQKNNNALANCSPRLYLSHRDLLIYLSVLLPVTQKSISACHLLLPIVSWNCKKINYSNHLYSVHYWQVCIAAQGWFAVGDSMTHKGHWQCHRCSSQTDNKPRIPLKLGLETMTHVLKRRHNATTTLWTLKSKHTLTLTPYGIGDHAAVYMLYAPLLTQWDRCASPQGSGE